MEGSHPSKLPSHHLQKGKGTPPVYDFAFTCLTFLRFLFLGTSHTKTCQLFPAKIEILDLIEFFVDLKNPKIHPDPFSEGLL